MSKTGITVTCLGDSNTFGYDPRTGMAYPAGSWADLIGRETGWEVQNFGALGETVPHGMQTRQAMLRLSERGLKETESFLWIMLGSNDILDGCSAEETAQRMEKLLSILLSKWEKQQICLIAPVSLKEGTWVLGRKIIEESVRLQDAYSLLAGHLEIPFIQTGGWKIPLCSDGVHFTQEGHRIFAEKILSSHSLKAQLC